MKTEFKQGQIVSWRFRGMRAVGVYLEDNCISVAVNYLMDRNVKEGDLWHFEEIHKHGGIRLANEEEIITLISALNKNKHPYKYNYKDKTIRDYNAFPTAWMRFKEEFIGRLGL